MPEKSQINEYSDSSSNVHNCCLTRDIFWAPNWIGGAHSRQSCMCEKWIAMLSIEPPLNEKK